jgi:RecA/RadA recombinase
MSFLEKMLKATQNEEAFIAADEEAADSFIDTGSYTLNALVSGSIHNGYAGGKVTALAGEPATGKTFFAMSTAKHFLDSDPEAHVIYFDTENAINKNMMAGRGIDVSRVGISRVDTVEQFRFSVIQILDEYLALPEKQQKPMFMVLDSLGMLSTSKEMKDTAEGKETRDMTRAQMVKSTFRTITSRLGKTNIPLLLTNHTYMTQGVFASKKMSGGSGLEYAASTIIFLTKQQDKDGTDVVGANITCMSYKSRATKEKQKVQTKINFVDGLLPYHGLVDLAVKHGIFKKVSTKIELPDGTKKFEKAIYREPEKYFTDEIMERLDEAAAAEFSYGSEFFEQEELEE